MEHGGQRIGEIDFVKCVLIILMVAFHIVYFGDRYLYAKQMVYTFHMPIFLIISGYMARSDKPWKEHWRSMWWLFVPYIVMELMYVIMASVLPIREHIDHLTPAVIAGKLLLDPLGPYWYLHTLLVCCIVYNLVFKLLDASDFTRFIISGLILYAFSQWLFSDGFIVNALYFLAGAIIRRSGTTLLCVFRPSLVAVLPVAVLALYPDNLHSSAAGGVMTVFFMFCLLLSLYRYVRGMVRDCALRIGRNTLVILLFSPVFTALAKFYQPWLTSIDQSGIVFMAVTVVAAVGGSMLAAWLMDRLRLSRFVFGRNVFA